jgi:hypothetical protein
LLSIIVCEELFDQCGELAALAEIERGAWMVTDNRRHVGRHDEKTPDHFAPVSAVEQHGFKVPSQKFGHDICVWIWMYALEFVHLQGCSFREQWFGWITRAEVCSIGGDRIRRAHMAGDKLLFAFTGCLPTRIEFQV